MVENFKLGELGGIISYLKKEKGKIVFFNSKSRYVSIDPEALKTWLDEATKPGYRIIHAMNFDDEHYEIIDDDRRAINGYGGVIARFFVKQDSYNAKAEAEKLCERLNKGEGD